MRAALFSSVSRKATAAVLQTRNIAVGTNMITASSDVTLQQARPWYANDAEGSNMAVDNAISMKDLFAGKTVAVFGVPAPFTGTCTTEHYPPYKALAGEFKKAGADEVVCYAVSDPYAHNGWGVSLQNNNDDIRFLSDADASFAKAFEVDSEYAAASLGLRSKRFSMLVKDGVVKSFHFVDKASEDADTLLADLKNFK
jgi:peroxiredoxin